MKKKLLIVSIIIIAVIGVIAFDSTNSVDKCMDYRTWYTCDPKRCTQTVTYWDSWRECIDYSNTMGYSECKWIQKIPKLIDKENKIENIDIIK